MEPPRILEDAESLWKRGDLLAYWERLDDLPAIERAEPAVLDHRCRLCIAMGKWDIGFEMAQCLNATVDEGHHVTAAEFCVACGHHLAGEGNVEKARECVGEAVRCWKGIRRQVVDDDLLMGIF